jgi:uncharacterized repeat protein (TIGR03803 family)
MALAACSRVNGLQPLPYEASTADSPGDRLPGSVSYKSLYSFGQYGKADDGSRPQANLVRIGSELYGTTQYGGTTNDQCLYGCGIVFEVSPSGREQVLYRFKGGADGASPVASLIVVKGTLYGTTSAGGTGRACLGGCGTVFSLGTSGKSERVVYSFRGGADGINPVASLTALNGSLYGTTQYGGAHTRLCSSGCGTVFRLSAPGAESVVYRFKGGRDGSQPIADLLALNGALYGTTQYGGVGTAFCETGCGTIFRLSTSGVEKTLYAFEYGPKLGDGAFPSAGLTALDNQLYGTTLGGGQASEGTVFKADPSSGAERVLHSFYRSSSEMDGEFPLAGLVAANGLLYGTTRNGGTSGLGTVFEISPPGAESVLYNFTGKPNGAGPQAGLIFAGGTLFGTTTYGGMRSLGTVFQLTP